MPRVDLAEVIRSAWSIRFGDWHSSSSATMRDKAIRGVTSSIVYLHCKAGKRQCDKLLPCCSRCQRYAVALRIHLNCQYQSSSSSPALLPPHEGAGLSAPTSSTHSCMRCRVQKRKCDRQYPFCSRCLRLKLPCEYDSTKGNRFAILPIESAICLSSDLSGMPLALSHLKARAGPELVFQLNIVLTCRNYCNSSLLPWSCYQFIRNWKSCSHLHTKWIQVAIEDTCLFHATTFSASASIDYLNGLQHNSITTYHQICAIRLLNEHLRYQAAILDYGTLASVIPLIYYKMVSLDKSSTIVHQNGLLNMLRFMPQKPGDYLGPLIGVIKIAMISLSCVFEIPLAWDCLLADAIHPTSILRNLATSVTFKDKESILKGQTMKYILDVYKAVTFFDRVIDPDSTSIQADF